jgi:hypothetical protein
MQQRSRLFISCDALAVLLIGLLWCRAVGARIVLSMTADKVFVPVGEEPIWPAAAGLVSSMSFLLVVCLSVAIIVLRFNDLTRPGLWRLVVLLAPWLVILTRTLYSGSPSPESVLYLVVILALAALRPSPRVLAALGALVVLTAVAAIAFGFLQPDAGRVREADGTVRERVDKAVFPALGLLQGMFTAENILGLYLAIGIAAVFMLRRRWLRLSGLAVVGFAICWSSSRIAMFAAGGMLLVGALTWACAKFGRHRTASALARLAALATLAVMSVLPLAGWLSSAAGWDPDAFTGRGVIWNGSLTEWSSQSPLFGMGRDWYAQVAATDTSQLSSGAFSGHNQFVQWLATGGVLLALVAVASLLIQTFATTTPGNPRLPIAAMLVTGTLVCGWLEVPLGYIDNAAFWSVTVVPLAVLFLAKPDDSHDEPPDR